MAFHDLDICWCSPVSTLQATVARAMEMQFSIVAVSQSLELKKFLSLTTEPGAKNNPGKKQYQADKRHQRAQLEAALVPPNISLDTLVPARIRNLAESRGVRLVLLTRLNILADELSVSSLKDFFREFQPQLDRYDLLCLQVNDAATLHYGCESAPVDLLSVNLHQRPDFSLQSRLLKLAHKRGLHFEVKVSPLFSEGALRNTVAWIHDFVVNMRGPQASLVMSSGATSEWDCRSPSSLAALADMLGVSSHMTTHLVGEHARATVQHALARKKTLLGAMAIQRLMRTPGIKSVQTIPKIATEAAVEDKGNVLAELEGPQLDVTEKHVKTDSGSVEHPGKVNQGPHTNPILCTLKRTAKEATLCPLEEEGNKRKKKKKKHST